MTRGQRKDKAQAGQHDANGLKIEWREYEAHVRERECSGLDRTEFGGERSKHARLGEEAKEGEAGKTDRGVTGEKSLTRSQG
eukprot:1020412-Rhodomonas_salina.2